MAEMVKARLNGEYEIVLPKHRADRPEWYRAEGWEAARLAWLKQTIESQHRPIVYYVGAEEGEMPALCNMWGADVALFEPNPKMWPNIKAIWEANDLEEPMLAYLGFASNLTRQPFITKKPSDVWPFCANEEVIGNHGFKELYLEAENYNQVKIDDIASIYTPPTIITFDCEGSDWEVMKGAEHTIIDHKPVIFGSIHPEFMFHQYRQYSRDFRTWLIRFGYKETILDYQHELHVVYEPIEALQ